MGHFLQLLASFAVPDDWPELYSAHFFIKILLEILVELVIEIPMLLFKIDFLKNIFNFSCAEYFLSFL